MLVKSVDFQPAEVRTIARRPDDRCDFALRQIEGVNGVPHAVCILHGGTRLRLLWQIEAVSGSIGVRFIQHGEQVRITLVKVLDEIRSKAHYAVAVSFGTPDQDHSLRREAAKVDGVAAMGPAHGNRYMLFSGLPCSGVPLAENTQPPAVVASTIRSRRTVMRPNRKVDAPARFQELLGDLGARRARSHYQHRAFGQLVGVAVSSGVQLQYSRLGGNHPRHDGTLECAGRGDNTVGLNHPCGSLQPKTGTARLPRNVQYFDATTDRRRNLLCVGDEIVCNGFLRRKVIGTHPLVDIAERETRETIVPSWTVRNQGIPSF